MTAYVAQLVEHEPEEPVVDSSILSVGTWFLWG